MTRSEIEAEMQVYFDKLYHFKSLTEENKSLVANLSQKIISLPPNTEIAAVVSKCILTYYQNAKQNNDEKAMSNAEALIQKKNPVVQKETPEKVQENLPTVTEEHPLALTRTPNSIKTSSKAAFVNVAILLYGVFNIGFILAVAILK